MPLTFSDGKYVWSPYYKIQMPCSVTDTDEYSSDALFHCRGLKVQTMKAVEFPGMSLAKIFGKFRIEEDCVLLMLGLFAIALCSFIHSMGLVSSRSLRLPNILSYICRPDHCEMLITIDSNY
jgi:hypothetical protein